MDPEGGAHHLVPGRGGLPGVLGGPGRTEGLGTIELHTGANLEGVGCEDIAKENTKTIENNYL